MTQDKGKPRLYGKDTDGCTGKPLIKTTFNGNKYMARITCKSKGEVTLNQCLLSLIGLLYMHTAQFVYYRETLTLTKK